MFDLIIIGAGPAGLTAALYALRACINIMVIDKAGTGGQAMIIDRIDNFPGFQTGSSGFEWVENVERQLKKYDFKVVLETVVSLKHYEEWVVKTDAHEYHSHAVICATGAAPKKLGVKGEQELLGKGVSYCATCDGAFFKDKCIVVVGGGDTAVKDAIFLTRFGKKVIIIHRRDRLRAEKVLQNELLRNPKVMVQWNSIVTAIEGDEVVKGVRIKDVVTAEEHTIACEGVFILVGVTPETHFLKELVHIDKAGFIKTNQNMETGIPGLFAAGDCRQQLLRQVVTACGDGATAASAAQHYVDTQKGTSYDSFKSR